MSKTGQWYMELSQSDEFQEGYEACCHRQLARLNNPYTDSDRRMKWHLGWDAGRTVEESV